ncbi:MAG TPA: hypothetical protein VMT46_10300 [Anaerolineaceae bacterium]|nr:hypothetical protein [Anaerolineaceae bacterium]
MSFFQQGLHRVEGIARRGRLGSKNIEAPPESKRYPGKTKLIIKQDLIGIYKQYSPELFRYSVRLLNDQDLAEDCVSETLGHPFTVP